MSRYNQTVVVEKANLWGHFLLITNGPCVSAEHVSQEDRQADTRKPDRHLEMQAPYAEM